MDRLGLGYYRDDHEAAAELDQNPKPNPNPHANQPSPHTLTQQRAICMHHCLLHASKQVSARFC